MRISWTCKNLYPQICDFAALYVAYRRARCGKRDRAAVASFEFDLERNLLQLQAELQAHTYAPGGYTNFDIHEPKRRLVSGWNNNDNNLLAANRNNNNPTNANNNIGLRALRPQAASS